MHHLCKPLKSWGTGGHLNFYYIKLIAINRYNKPCKNACEGLGKDYFWCDTLETDSWDYCSPEGEFSKGENDLFCKKHRKGAILP